MGNARKLPREGGVAGDQKKGAVLSITLGGILDRRRGKILERRGGKRDRTSERGKCGKRGGAVFVIGASEGW